LLNYLRPARSSERNLVVHLVLGDSLFRRLRPDLPLCRWLSSPPPSIDLVPPLNRSQACTVTGASFGYFNTVRRPSDREPELVRRELISLSYFHNRD
jgi:hypothetical protein